MQEVQIVYNVHDILVNASSMDEAAKELVQYGASEKQVYTTEEVRTVLGKALLKGKRVAKSIAEIENNDNGLWWFLVDQLQFIPKNNWDSFLTALDITSEDQLTKKLRKPYIRSLVIREFENFKRSIFVLEPWQIFEMSDKICRICDIVDYVCEEPNSIFSEKCQPDLSWDNIYHLQRLLDEQIFLTTCEAAVQRYLHIKKPIEIENKILEVIRNEDQTLH